MSPSLREPPEIAVAPARLEEIGPGRGTAAASRTALGWAGLAVIGCALGAVAIGALAIGRLAIGRARLQRVEIDDLVVGRLRVREALDDASGVRMNAP
jgi:hypothetical protein